MPIKTPKEIEADANARANKINYQAQKRVLMTETANLKAVTTAFQAWLQKAPLANRRAFLDTFVGYAKGTAAERIAQFKIGMHDDHEAKATQGAEKAPETRGNANPIAQSEGGKATA